MVLITNISKCARLEVNEGLAKALWDYHFPHGVPRMSSIAVDESALQILDIDECADEDQNDCDPNAKCSNIVGSYNCRCLKGYEGDGRDCTGKSLCCFINVFYMQLEKYSQTCI